MVLVIVDTNVARSAGEGRPSANTPAPESVRALDTIYQRAREFGDMQVAFSMSLVAEWNVHARKYALDWLVTMRSRGFACIVELDAEKTERIRAAAEKIGQNCLVPISKDLHLVCLAVQSGRRVVSHETNLPRHLKRATIYYDVLGSLHWARPCHAATMPWLQAGAPDDVTLMVDSFL